MEPKYPVVIDLPVAWGDQDAFGHVNNTVYFRWCESSRVEYLIQVGLWQMMETHQVGPIVASLSCNFKRPLNFPDTVGVGSRITRIGNTSLRMEHRIDSRATGLLAAEVHSTLVVMDYRAGRPVPVPESVRSAIERLEGSALESKK